MVFFFLVSDQWMAYSNLIIESLFAPFSQFESNITFGELLGYILLKLAENEQNRRKIIVKKKEMCFSLAFKSWLIEDKNIFIKQCGVDKKQQKKKIHKTSG